MLVRGAQELLSATSYKPQYQALQAQYDALQEKYTQEVEHFQSIQEEAFQAIEISNSEVKRSSSILLIDFDRKKAEYEAHCSTQIEEVHHVLGLLHDRYKQALFCLQYMMIHSQEVEARWLESKHTCQVSNKMMKGYDMLIKDVKTMAGLSAVHDSTPYPSRRKVSMKTAALLALAANRIRNLHHQQQAIVLQNMQAVQKLEYKFSLHNNSPQNIQLFAELWALPSTLELSRQTGDVSQRAELVTQYISHFLTIKTHESSNTVALVKAKHRLDLVQRISQGMDSSIYATKRVKRELYGQAELNTVHARLLTLTHERAVWTERQDMLKVIDMPMRLHVSACLLACLTLVGAVGIIGCGGTAFTCVRTREECFAGWQQATAG